MRLQQEDQSLRNGLSEMLDSVLAIAESERGLDQGYLLEISDESASTAVSPSRILSHEEQQLRNLSDLAAKVFGAQLIIVQSADESAEQQMQP